MRHERGHLEADVYTTSDCFGAAIGVSASVSVMNMPPALSP